jgi:hypothetical protein
MSTAAIALATVGSRFTIYAGSILFSLGFFGNLVTIHLLRPAGHTPVIFILIILSVANSISLVVGLLNRVLVAIVANDPTLVSAIWCRLRVYIGQTSVLFCQSCACLASINCFLSSCRGVRWRRFVSLTICRRCIVIVALFWLVHGLFNPLLTELIIVPGRAPSCSLTSTIAVNYTGFFLRPVFIGILPICTLSTFGILTYRNLNRLRHKRRFDQQILSKMLLFQMIAYVLGAVPYASFYLYQSITTALWTKSTMERTRDNLALDFINIILYMPQSSAFYVYYLSSAIFRRQVKTLCSCCQRHRIQPLPTNNHELQ